ncbi:hypothetical protein WS87_11020 [Burkholderia sp. MSMB0856]|nr:hypothetical protein WS87_11020 [Burkholderia sp. MSMB0856]KVH38873.1 hypothetical protein WS87_05220 [Burkholderia sp. MSMB0856]
MKRIEPEISPGSWLCGSANVVWAAMAAVLRLPSAIFQPDIHQRPIRLAVKTFHMSGQIACRCPFCKALSKRTVNVAKRSATMDSEHGVFFDWILAVNCKLHFISDRNAGKIEAIHMARAGKFGDVVERPRSVWEVRHERESVAWKRGACVTKQCEIRQREWVG